MTDAIRPAGVTFKTSDDTAAVIFEHVPEVVRIKHPLTQIPDRVHGAPSIQSGSVERCFSNMRKEGLEKVLQEKAEQIYLSRQKEPLGRGRVRGYSLPPDGFRFGKRSAERECEMADLVNPVDQVEDENVRLMYIKTHNSYDPGEQVKRHYKWPSDFSEYLAFGHRDKAKTNRIEDALKWEHGNDPTKIVTKRVDDFWKTYRDIVGKGRNLLQGPIPVQTGHRFGLKHVGNHDTVASCIHSNFKSVEELQPDSSLGRSLPRIRV